MSRYFIIAGNLQEFNAWRLKNMNRFLGHGLVYVVDVTYLKGYSNPEGFFIGSWRQRKDIDEILEQLIIAVMNDEEKLKTLVTLRNEIQNERTT